MKDNHFQAPAALLLTSNSTVHIGRESGWTPEAAWTQWRINKSQPCLESKPGLEFLWNIEITHALFFKNIL